MLIDLNQEIYGLKLQLLQIGYEGMPEFQVQKGELDQWLHLRFWMVLGEGSVFFFLLVFGIWKTRQSFHKEVLLANQQKNFLLSITHELKSPITAVKLYLQTLMTRKLDEEKREEIALKAIADTDRLNSLVENLLLATKIDKSDYSLHYEQLDFSELINSNLTKLQSGTDKEITLKSEIEPNIAVSGDRLALHSIIQNLYENAVKYSSGKPILDVSLKKKKDQAILTFTDQGNGIPDNEKTKIFEKFYRIGNEDTRKTKGTGLGLYIVKRLVEKHKGQISVRDNEPKGTVFEVILKSD